MKTLTISLFTLYLLFFASFIGYSQNWEKKFEKIDEAYEMGDYKKAAKQIAKLKKKALKKLGEKNGIMANILIRESKNNIGYGVLTEVYEPLEKAIEVNKEVNFDYKTELGYIYKEACEIMLQYGDFNSANSYLIDAKSAFEAAGVMEEVGGDLDVMEAKIMLGKGFYRKAIQLVEDQSPNFRTRFLSASPKIADIYKRDYAELLIIKANALRKMGDYNRSDSAFRYNETWIDENLKKTDILYAENALYNTLLLKENGLALDAQAKMFEDAYVQGTRKYLPSHRTVMRINENLMTAYYANNDKGRLERLSAEFKTALRDFPKNSIHQVAEDLIEIYFSYSDQDLKKLENRINAMLSNPIMPEKHNVRIELLEFANSVGLLMGKHKNTENYQKSILSIKEGLMGIESPEYHLTKIKLANYYIDYDDKFDDVKDIYETSFNEIVDPQITEGHPMYLDILNHLAKYYEETDQYKLAAKTLDRSLMVARKKYDNKDIEYGKTLEKIASLQINIGQYEKAEENLKESIQIFEDLKSEFADAYIAVAMITEARLFEIKGEFDSAEDNIFASEKLKEKSAITFESTGLNFNENLASIYLNLGRLSDAEKIIKSSIKTKTRQFGRESRQLNKVLVLDGQLKLIKGEYTESENTARRINNITTSIFGSTSTKTVPSKILLADIYTTIGDFDKAEILLKEAIDIQKSQFGDDHIDVGKSVSKLALVKYFKNDPISEVNSLFTEAESIIGSRLGSQNPTYAEILKDMAIAAMAQGQYTAAFSYLDDAGRIWEKRLSKRNNIKAAEIDVLQGDIFYRQKDYKKADNQYEKAKKRFEKFFDDKHPEFVKVQSKLSKTYYMQGNWKKSQDQMEEVLAKYKDFIVNYFPALSEREKAKFWNTIKTDYEFYNTLIVSRNRNEKYIGELFNNALLTKALLLNSSIKIRERIMNSTDEELKSTYEDWLSKKELLTAALSMSTEQLAETGIDPNQLSNEVELLEKDLSLKSELFSSGNDNKQITWENVKASLKENEVAIEMVRFRVFDHTFSDSVMYALLYVTGDTKSQPSLILLQNGSDMENRYLKYYRNSIKFRIKDRFSYDAYWQPIISQLGTFSTMYISPDGVYNQINLEAIPSNDGRYVLDNSNIVLVSNTKDLFLNRIKTRLVTEQQNAMMVGNPTFYVDTSPGQPVPESGLTRESAAVITDLPGTKKELDELDTYLENKGWEIEKFTDLAANEQTIKEAQNPRIFHVATHGFFQSKKLEASALDAELNVNYLYENPLLKSGLLLSGAGDILNETQYNYNIDNGILTAYEAMNLNLDQTDLVVLSACETGLGEIEAGEGVYGLQRAFLVAGANTIIMSLFKVSDEATQELMVKFYRKWIETGNKRKAFVDAKKEIRNEYGDPIYWGPFIMIGLD